MRQLIRGAVGYRVAIIIAEAPRYSSTVVPLPRRDSIGRVSVASAELNCATVCHVQITPHQSITYCLHGSMRYHSRPYSKGLSLRNSSRMEVIYVPQVSDTPRTCSLCLDPYTNTLSGRGFAFDVDCIGKKLRMPNCRLQLGNFTEPFYATGITSRRIR